MAQNFSPSAPSDGPAWLPRFASSIADLFRRIMPAPLRLKDYATVDLPAAADFVQGIAWNATVSRVTYSDGSSWVQVMPYTAGAALTKTDDTNVTLTLGGTPATALLAATSLTLGWTGTLAAGRGGTGVSSLGDITRANDTNVTLTLGGTPTGAVITSTSFTLGWTGTLAAGRGGTGVSTLGDLSKTDDTNVTLTLGGTPTGALIKSASITVGWTGQLSVARGGTSFTSYTIGDLIQASATGTLAKLAAAATGNVLISGGVGVVSSWGKVGLTTHVSGNLPFTNLVNASAASIVGATAAGAFAELTPLQGRGVLVLGSTDSVTFGQITSNTVSASSSTITFRGTSGGAAATTGLRLMDTDDSHTLRLECGSNLTANRRLTLTTGDASRTLDISAASVTITADGATFLATPSSANLAALLTDETGTGSVVFAISPTLVTPALGTPSSGTATNLTGLPLTTGVTGVLPTANGGTNTDVGLAWSTTTPTPTSGSGTFTSVSGNVRALKMGKTVTFSAAVTITTNGTAASFIDIALPFASVNSGFGQSFGGREVAATGISCGGTLLNNSTTLRIQKYDGTYLGLNGYVLSINGTYEAA